MKIKLFLLASLTISLNAVSQKVNELIIKDTADALIFFI